MGWEEREGFKHIIKDVDFNRVSHWKRRKKKEKEKEKEIILNSLVV